MHASIIHYTWLSPFVVHLNDHNIVNRLKTHLPWTSPVVQWLRIHLLMQGHRFNS